MKNIVLLTFVVILTNPAAGMGNQERQPVNDDALPDWFGIDEENDTIFVPNRMEVIHRRNYCLGLKNIVMVAVLTASIYQGSEPWAIIGAVGLVFLLPDFIKGRVEIKLHDDQRYLTTLSYTSPVGTQNKIVRVRKQIDDWNRLRRENPAAAQELKNKLRKKIGQVNGQIRQADE